MKLKLKLIVLLSMIGIGAVCFRGYTEATEEKFAFVMVDTETGEYILQTQEHGAQDGAPMGQEDASSLIEYLGGEYESN